MSIHRLRIPAGMQDTLPGECQAKRREEERLRKLFGLYGYQEIETPVLEYLDTLDDDTYGYRPERVWKTFDRAGHVLCVRPDSTIPSVRVACGPLKGQALPMRLCYVQSAAEYERDSLSMLCEQTQAGVELMGESGAEADAEVIALAVEALRGAGLRGFQVELGQAGFFGGFMQAAGLTEEQAAVVRRLTEEKNALGIQIYLREQQVTGDAAERLMLLPRLYGGVDVLEEAEKLCDHPACREAVDNLRAVIACLRLHGVEDVAIDLGMTHAAGYYTGLIFRAQTSEVGQPIVSGGRYDALPGRFGRSMPAVGFALRLKLLLIALERQGTSFSQPRPDRLIGFAPGCLQEALRFAAACREQGQSVAMLYHADADILRGRAAAGDAGSAVYVTEKGAQLYFGEGAGERG